MKSRNLDNNQIQSVIIPYSLFPNFQLFTFNFQLKKAAPVETAFRQYYYSAFSA